MKHPYLIDLNDRDNWMYPHAATRPDGSIIEEQGTINFSEGPHRLFCFTDSVVYPEPGADTDPNKIMFHEHQEGWEAFFLDEGTLDLYVDGKKAFVEAGSIVFYQPYQAHGLVFHSPVKIRGFFHDWKSTDTIPQRELLKKMRPEVLQDGYYQKHILSKEHDHFLREPIVCREVPVEQMSAVRHIDRPMEAIELEGVTMKMLAARWENGGVNELWAAEMEPGFHAEWLPYPAHPEMFYITAGEIEFKVYDETFTAYPECLVKIPIYAEHSIRVLKKAVMYDIGGLTRWQGLLEDYASIRKYDPARAGDRDAITALKAKYGCQILSCGLR